MDLCLWPPFPPLSPLLPPPTPALTLAGARPPSRLGLRRAAFRGGTHAGRFLAVPGRAVSPPPASPPADLGRGPGRVGARPLAAPGRGASPQRPPPPPPPAIHRLAGPPRLAGWRDGVPGPPSGAAGGAWAGMKRGRAEVGGLSLCSWPGRPHSRFLGARRLEGERKRESGPPASAPPPKMQGPSAPPGGLGGLGRSAPGAGRGRAARRAGRAPLPPPGVERHAGKKHARACSFSFDWRRNSGPARPVSRRGAAPTRANSVQTRPDLGGRAGQSNPAGGGLPFPPGRGRCGQNVRQGLNVLFRRRRRPPAASVDPHAPP
jgi:hypothetical protein